MTFADLVGGESIFLDANPLVYHFAPHPKDKKNLNSGHSRLTTSP